MPLRPKWRGHRAARHGAPGPCAGRAATSCPELTIAGQIHHLRAKKTRRKPPWQVRPP